MMYSSSRNWKVKQLWEDFSGIRIEWEHTGNTMDFHFRYGSNPLYDIFGWMNIHKRKLLPRLAFWYFGAVWSQGLPQYHLWGWTNINSLFFSHQQWTLEPTRIQTCLEHIHCGDRELRYCSQWPLGCVPKFSIHLHIGSNIYIYIDHHVVLVYLLHSTIHFLIYVDQFGNCSKAWSVISSHTNFPQCNRAPVPDQWIFRQILPCSNSHINRNAGKLEIKL